jgi:hypothetical protein
MGSGGWWGGARGRGGNEGMGREWCRVWEMRALMRAGGDSDFAIAVTFSGENSIDMIYVLKRRLFIIILLGERDVAKCRSFEFLSLLSAA